MARTHGGSHTDVDAPTTRTHGGSDEGGDTPSRRRPAHGHAGNVDTGHEQVQATLQAGRATGNGGGPSTASSPTRSATASTVTGKPLPPGYSYDSNGRLKGPDGRWASDPTAPPSAHNRDSEYPGGYRQSTHDDMTSRYTREGRRAGGVPRDPTTNERIPRDQLTWFDRRGRPVPADQLTYEHHRPVVQHWNDEGRFQTREERNDWYNNPSNLSPMTRSDNSRGGALLTDRYLQDTGGRYTSSSATGE